MSVLEAIAGTRAPDVVGNIEQGRTDVLNRRLGAQKAEMGDIELAAAKAPKKVSFKDQLAEMQAKSEVQFRIASALLNTPKEQRRQRASSFGFGDNAILYKDDPKPEDSRDVNGGEGVATDMLSDEALKHMRSEAVYGMDAVGEFGKAEEDAARLEAMGDMEGAQAARAAMANKYGKEGKIESVELHPKGNPNESFWVNELPNGKLERDGKILTQAQLDQYTREGVKKSAAGSPADFGLNKPVASGLQKDVTEGRIQQAAFSRIKNAYNKDFLTLQGKIKGGVLWGLDKIDALPEGDKKAWLAAKTKFDTGVNQAFNIYRRWVTGAAAAMSELERLEQAYINVKDSPTQFMAKLAELQDFGKRTEEVRMRMLKDGLGDPDDPEAFNKAWKSVVTDTDEDPTTAQEMVDLLEYQSTK